MNFDRCEITYIVLLLIFHLKLSESDANFTNTGASLDDEGYDVVDIGNLFPPGKYFIHYLCSCDWICDDKWDGRIAIRKAYDQSFIDENERNYQYKVKCAHEDGYCTCRQNYVLSGSREAGCHCDDEGFIDWSFFDGNEDFKKYGTSQLIEWKCPVLIHRKLNCYRNRLDHGSREAGCNPPCREKNPSWYGSFSFRRRKRRTRSSRRHYL